MATGDEGPSFFARFIEALEEPTQKTSHAQKMLNWIQHKWDKPVIRTRDIYRHGPRPLRNDRKNALEAAEILERRGWLVPLKAPRRDVKRWQITIGPA
jgi:hypothetical protein